MENVAPAPEGPSEAELEIARGACLAIAEVWPETPQQPLAASEHVYQRIGIIGGGTAGYLTALALRRTHPQLEVTLIESSKIPVIGVDEAITRCCRQTSSNAPTAGCTPGYQPDSPDSWRTRQRYLERATEA